MYIYIYIYIYIYNIYIHVKHSFHLLITESTIIWYKGCLQSIRSVKWSFVELGVYQYSLLLPGNGTEVKISHSSF